MRGQSPACISGAVRCMAYGLLLASVVTAATVHANGLTKNSPDIAANHPFLQLSQLRRTLFTAKDGLPSSINAITEDRDGYLWLGGSAGLFRFDGVHFERMFKGQIPTGTITTLFGDKGGNLWVGGFRGAVTRIHDGVAEPINRGLTKPTIMSFKQMVDGTLWVVTSSGPARLIDGTWHLAGPSEGMDGKGVRVAGTGQDGSYWIFATDAAYRLRQGAHRFDRYSSDEGFAAMANLPADAIFPANGMTSDLIVDSYGALWVPTNGKLVRLHADAGPGQKQLVTENITSQGDGADIQEVTADFVDAQGNVWIATPGGLEQFRATRFAPLVLPLSAYAPEMINDRDGGFWIASHSDTPPMRVGNAVTVYPDVGGPTVCMASDADGSVWFSGGKGILRYKDGRVSAISIPPSPGGPVFMQRPGLGCVDMKVAADGSLWISMQGYGVSRWDGHVWTAIETNMASSIQFEGARTWLAFDSGKLTSIEQGKIIVYSGKNGPDLGALGTIYPGSSGLWITGDKGVAVKIGTQFHRLFGIHGERFENVRDIVQLTNGDVWMTLPRGVYRVPAAEIRLALSTADHAVSYTTFDETDGATSAGHLRAFGDGLLGISMPHGVAWIDAQHIPRAPPPPPTSIETLNDRDVRFSGALPQVLEKGTQSVTVTYTAAALSTPSRTHFRYLIDGVDEGWQAAGDRREAHYANLGPGHYTFRIEAANADGFWANQPTSLSFQILPEFYQTWWFKAFCALLALAGLWLLHRLRVTQIYAQLDARTQERETMARDFHDTLLQSFQSLLLHVADAALNVREAVARERLETALQVTESALNEGRDKIGQLRSLAEPLEDLSTDITHLAHQLSALHPIAFSMQVDGEPRPLNVSAGNDVHAIVRELVTNAFRHSQANSLHVELHYGRRALTIVVTDDGDGALPLGSLSSKPGHWGLQGMQERAGRVGARLAISAARSGKGTCATLKIPARFVYLRMRWFQ
jgi:signal transduction histidine kinase/ligand-binding sensor domain-containing protein